MLRTEPRGLGMYIRKLSKKAHGRPAAAAKKAKANGVTWVALLCCWQDRKQQHDRHVEYNRDKLGDYASAFADVGIDPWVWSFPRAGWVVEHGRTVGDALDHPAVAGILLDPEVYFKWDTEEDGEVMGMRGTREAVEFEGQSGTKDWAQYWARQLVRDTLDQMDERHGIGITSYGVQRFHKNFPWEDFGGVGFGSPQLYRVSRELVEDSVHTWGERWDSILPSIPTFGDQSGTNLSGHLKKFEGLDIQGLIAWSWRQTDRREWAVLREWAERFQPA